MASLREEYESLRLHLRHAGENYRAFTAHVQAFGAALVRLEQVALVDGAMGEEPTPATLPSAPAPAIGFHPKPATPAQPVDITADAVDVTPEAPIGIHPALAHSVPPAPTVAEPPTNQPSETATSEGSGTE